MLLDNFGLILKNKMTATATFMLKNAIFRQLVLLRCKLNLFVIDMLDSYIHLLCTCEHVTLCVFTQGLPWGITFHAAKFDFQPSFEVKLGSTILKVPKTYLSFVLEVWDVK